MLWAKWPKCSLRGCEQHGVATWLLNRISTSAQLYRAKRHTSMTIRVSPVWSLLLIEKEGTIHFYIFMLYRSSLSGHLRVNFAAS